MLSTGPQWENKQQMGLILSSSRVTHHQKSILPGGYAHTRQPQLSQPPWPERHRLFGRRLELLTGASIDLTAQHQNAVPAPRDLLSLRVPASLKRVGREMRMLVEGADDQAEIDPSLLRIIARAHDILERLSQDTDLTVHDVAHEERVTAAYIYALLRLPWLAPDITTAIVNGRQPHQLSAKSLMRKASRLPADWAEQRTLLGF
jgi:hypothetical protein